MRLLPSRLHQVWLGLRRICWIEHRREFKTDCERQIVYGITDLPTDVADAGRLLEVARAHGQIENRLFRVKDGTFAEGACPVRTANAPAALAHLRDCALTLARRKGRKPKPARQSFAANPRATITEIITA